MAKKQRRTTAMTQPMQEEWQRFMAFYKAQLFPDEDAIPIDHKVLMEGAFFMGGLALLRIAAGQDSQQLMPAAIQELTDWPESAGADTPWMRRRQ